MANIKTIERIVRASINGEFPRLREALEVEAENAKNLGQYNSYRRIVNLIGLIPNGKIVGAQSDTGALNTNSFKLGSEHLFEWKESAITLKEVILEERIKTDVAGFIREWKCADKLIANGIEPTNRVLFFGEPGTGKTKLAYAIANELKLPLLLVRLDELISSYLGKTGKNIKDIFDIAKHKNVIIFLDEIDTIAKHRDDEKELGELKRIVTVFLQNLDNLATRSLVIGATNHEALLDNAIWRRFPLKLKFNLPSLISRKKLFELFLKETRGAKLNYNLFAQLSEGYSGSAIEDVCQQIRKEIVLSGIKNISEEKILELFLAKTNPLGSDRIDKKRNFTIAKLLLSHGYKLASIAKITNMPYSTLKYQVEKWI